MALRIETRKAVIDNLLVASRTRNPDLFEFSGIELSADRDERFQDQSIFITDTDTGALLVFSRRDTFWTGSWGSFSITTSPTVDYIRSFYQIAFDWGEFNFPGVPYSQIFGEKCPWINELTANRTNFQAVDNVVSAINFFRPRTAIRLDPPRRLDLVGNNGEADFGLVFAHTVPIMFDKRNL